MIDRDIPNTQDTQPEPGAPTPSPTPSPVITTATVSVVIARVLSGLFAGFFLTYVMSVTVGLREVDDVTYVLTFQAINATIQNATFAVVFFGAVPATLLATALTRGRQRRMFAAGAGFLVATVLITFLCNVPLNDELATFVDVDAASAALARAGFEDTWNRWNLLRTITAVIGAVCVAAPMATSRSARRVARVGSGTRD